MIELSIIIVNYNVKEFLKNLLNSLKKAVSEIPTEIIVIDNASTDGSVEEIRLKFPDVKLIANEKNVGFGAANNQGFKIAKGNIFVLINPDTIVKENTFEKLIDFFKSKPDAGIVGCKVLNPDGTLQLACRRSFPGPWTSFTKVTGLSKLFPNSKLFARYNLTYLDENKINEVDAISGAFMMIKNEVYQKVGGFDNQFFMYGEDLDLCYRIQSAGYKVYYVPTTEIIHYKGESTKRSSLDETKVFYESMHLFVKKHLSSSLIVEGILRSAIVLRRFVAFLNLYKLSIISALIDFIFFSLSIAAAEKIYQPGSWSGFPEEVKPWIYFLPALVQIIITALAGGYKKNRLSVLRAITSLILGLIFFSSLTFFLKQFAFSRAVLIIIYSITSVFFILWRFIAKVFFKVGLSNDSGKTKTLIVGSEKYSQELVEKLKSSFTNIYSVEGFIGKSPDEIGDNIGSYKVIGSLENIIKVIKEKKIDKVIFSSHEISFEKMFSIVSNSDDVNVEFMVAGTELDYLVGKSNVTMLDNIPLLKVHYNIAGIGHKIIKSLFDIFLAIPILIFAYPLIYLIKLITRRKNDLTNFVLSTPEVFIQKKSFVGPKDSSYLDGLFLGKIGLTGLWYIENYDKSDRKELEKLNIYYAKNQNIWLDLEIIGKTFSKMFIKSEK